MVTIGIGRYPEADHAGNSPPSLKNSLNKAGFNAKGASVTEEFYHYA
jgi:hypothetical protein